MYWRRFAPRLCIVLAYTVVAILFSWPLVRQLDTAVLGPVGGDTGVYIWNQWMFQRELLAGRNPFTTDQIFSLTRTVDLSQHNYAPFLGTLATPLIPPLGVVAAFNVVFLVITVITATATYGLVRRVTSAGQTVAWLSGVLFAWSPVLVARSSGHMSLVAAAPLPAFLLCLFEAERSGRFGWAILVGLSVAWAAFCDVYFAVYCLMMGAGFVAIRVIHFNRVDRIASRTWTWAVDVALISLAGLLLGLICRGGTEFNIGQMVVSIRSFYTPVLVLTALTLARLAVAVVDRYCVSLTLPSRKLIVISGVGAAACIVPLLPVLYGLGQRMVDGRFVSPPTYWRSSPRGADLLGLFAANPNHVLVRAVRDLQAVDATAFVDYTASMSLVGILTVAIAVYRGHRPSFGWSLATIGFALLALGPFIHVAGYNTHVPGPWSLLRYVPVVSFARSPARFAIVAALGLAILFAAAMQFIRQRSGHQRVVLAVGALLIFELMPSPRRLYSAEIPSVYRRIAADPRPVRVMELPFGIRDGVFSAGNFSAQSQFFQTLHGKRLIGGYLSRISRRRINETRTQPTLDALLRLSEGQTLSSDELSRIESRARRFLTRSNLGYVVINRDHASAVLTEFVIHAWRLRELERDGPFTLYEPTLIAAAADSPIVP